MTNAAGSADSWLRSSLPSVSRQRYQTSTPASEAVRRFNRSEADVRVARQIVSRRRRTHLHQSRNDGGPKSLTRLEDSSAFQPATVCIDEISRDVGETVSVCTTSPHAAAVTSTSDDFQVWCADREPSNDPYRACSTNTNVNQPLSLLMETAGINLTSGCARNVRTVSRLNAETDDDDSGYDSSNVTGDDELMRRQHLSIGCDEPVRSTSHIHCVCRSCSTKDVRQRRRDNWEDERLEIDENQTENGIWTNATIAVDVEECAKSLTELAAGNRQVAALLAELFELMEDETNSTGIGCSDAEADDLQ